MSVIFLSSFFNFKFSGAHIENVNQTIDEEPVS